MARSASTPGECSAAPISPSARIGLRVVQVDFLRDPRWEEFVTVHPEGTVYHHPAWLEALERGYSCKPFGLACQETEGKLRAVLPLVHTQGILTGRRLTSLARTLIAGPLALDTEAAAAVVQVAMGLRRRLPNTRLELRVNSPRLEGLADGLVGVPWQETYVLELPPRVEELRFGNSRNHTRIKYSVNKAARLGVEVRSARSEDELRVWYTLYLDTMRRHIAPPRPYRFFEALWRIMVPRGMIRLLLAERRDAWNERGELVAGSMLLMCGQTVSYAFNGMRREAAWLRPNDAIQWRAIHEACRDGYRYYDFGEVAVGNQGLARFKSKWGAEPQWLYKYCYPAPTPSTEYTEVEAATAGEGQARRLAHVAWGRLPLRLTALLGKCAYRYS